MKGNTFLTVLLIGLAFFAGYLWNKVQFLEQKGQAAGTAQNTNSKNLDPQGSETPPQAKELAISQPSPEKDHWRGRKNARYVLIEYSDYQCPFCQRIHPDLIKLLDNNKDKLAWVYRDFPLSGHPKAPKSAEAAKCAAEQAGNDGFWKMADLIFEKMPALELTDLPSLAASIGLSQQKFTACLDSGKYAKKVNEQTTEGNQAGVRATPTSIIYDMKTGRTRVVEGALPYDSIQSELTSFIKQQEG